MHNALMLLKDTLNKVEVHGQENIKNMLFCMELVDRMSNAIESAVNKNDSDSERENV